ncbi:MAG: DUF3494 domain-containing protein [Thermoplasmata archaeon]|nr:DUF3494 domain-containing protein [Thermoplasmata archaeon]
MSVLVGFAMVFAAFVAVIPRATGTSVVPAATCGQGAVALGSTSSYAALSATSITNTGPSSLTGDIGVSPGSAVTGFPPGTHTGVENVANTASAAAKLDLTTAFNDAAGRSNCAVSVAGNLGGQTLTPGLYKSTSSLAISSGDLTLSGGGNPNAVFVFEVASALTTTSGRQVVLTNGAQAGNVFWQMGSSASLGTTSVMQGTLLAHTSITLSTGAQLNGRALAATGDVTLASATIVVPTTTAPTTYPVTFTESGLPAQTSWSVTFAGVLSSSMGTTNQFNVPSGSYAYTAGTVAAYTASPASGSVPVNGAPAAATIQFTAGASGSFSTVTFTESGLTAGTGWSVTLNGVLINSLTDTNAFSEANGTITYTIAAQSGYDATPSSGTLTVTGNSVAQPIVFTTAGSGGGGGGSNSPGTSSSGMPTWEWIAIGLAVLLALGALAAVLLMRNRKAGKT